MISEQDLDEITRTLEQGQLGDDIARALRAQWPDTLFTYCSDDDVSAHPVRETESFNLYFVTGRDSCISFTSSAEQATGVVIAEIEDFDED